MLWAPISLGELDVIRQREPHPLTADGGTEP